MTRTAFALIALMACASPSFAQDTPAAKRKPRTPLEFRAFVYAASESVESKETFEAILDKSSLMLIGGGAEVVIGRRWLVRGTYSTFSDTGTRVFVDTDDTVFPLNIPLKITVRPLDFSAGYRFIVKPKWALFAGAGLTRYELTEESTGESDDVSGNGWHLLAGAEMKPHRRVLLGTEAQWTRTDEILTGGAANALGEGKLGGIRLGLRAGIAF